MNIYETKSKCLVFTSCDDIVQVNKENSEYIHHTDTQCKI